MPVKDLKGALVDSMKDLLHAEKQLTKALPKMAKKATNAELSKAFETHLEETKQQVGRLEEAFEALGRKPDTKVCVAMKGLIEEGEEIIAEAEDNDTCDAMMIAAAQKVEHYEISSYGTVISWAEQLGETEVARLFKQTIEEEKKADQILTKIAESTINATAQT